MIHRQNDDILQRSQTNNAKSTPNPQQSLITLITPLLVKTALSKSKNDTTQLSHANWQQLPPVSSTFIPPRYIKATTTPPFNIRAKKTKGTFKQPVLRRRERGNEIVNE